MPLDVPDAIQFQGLDEARPKVLEFLKKVSESLETEGELKVTLSQAAKHGEMAVYETVYSFEESLEEFVDELFDATMKDAEDIGRGKIKYSVTVKGVKGRVTFAIVIPEREGEDEDDLDEVPNKRGLISQQMRHTESLMKITVGFVKDNQKSLSDQLKEARARIQFLESRHVETAKQYEELISMRHLRDLEFKKLENGERRKDQVGHILMQLAPVVASKFLGGGAKAAVEMGAKTPLEVMLEGFLSTFNQEQLGKLAQAGILSPIQMAGFMEIVGYILDRQAAEEEARKAKAGQAPPQQQPQEQRPPPQPRSGATVEGEFDDQPRA
jgi:hypothetical protein